MSIPEGLHLRVRNQIKAIWAANWPGGAEYPVLWRENDGANAPNAGLDPGAPSLPAGADIWLDLEVDFGVERVRAFGAGRGQTERLKFGSVIIRVMTMTGMQNDMALNLLSAAEAVFRSRREGDLSFVGNHSNFDTAADGNWAMTASLVAWEYRFRG